MLNLDAKFTFSFGKYVICIAVLIRVVFPVDFCNTVLDTTLSSNIQQGVTPKGGANAGDFLRDEDATSFIDCIASCCTNKKCNVAFFLEHCFLIICNTTWPEACNPEPREEKQFRETYWLTLRSVEIRSRSCAVGLADVCPQGEYCMPKNSHSRSGLCECVNGHTRISPGGSCLPEDAMKRSVPADIPSTIQNTWTTTTSIVTSSNGESTSQFQWPTSTIPFSTTVANDPPVAVVTPSSQELQQPADLVIDGSGSKDDSAVVSYLWEIVSKPMDFHLDMKSGIADQPILILQGLTPGFYQFKLTVTDSDNLQSSAFANATIIKGIDNPPTADAGHDVVVDLPVSSVVLSGNASQDDKRIVEYIWTKKPNDSLTADMEGTHDPFLRLSNLQVGLYTFSLTVVDSAGQTSTADVHVLVRPEKNDPPVALAGPDQTLSIPVGFVTLNGNSSTDDKKIVSYLWTFASGPGPVTIDHADSAVATVSKMTIGQYKFQLTVQDEGGLQSSAITTVTIREVVKRPPSARAGGNMIVTLPIDVVRIDGSKSNDDMGIVAYSWTKDKNSPAAGDILYNSSQEAVLQLINVVSGRYIFTLEVKDADGLTSQDTMSLIVQPDPLELNLVELHLATDTARLTEKSKAMFAEQLALLTKSSISGNTRVTIRHILPDVSSEITLVTFYVESVTSDQAIIWSGPEVVRSLKKTIPSSLEILDFQITHFDTVVCQINCSGHGSCDPVTRHCICDAFWLEDFVKAHFGEQISNCDWSMLYVILIVIFIILVTVTLVFAVICFCRRCGQLKPKLKRHRYMLLEERVDDEDFDTKGGNSLRLLQKGRRQSSSLMQSESDFSSEETIFVNNKRPANGSAGKVPNGSTQRSKVKA